MALLVVAAACSGGSGDVASPFTDAPADASTAPTTPATSPGPVDPAATDATGVGSSTTDGAAPTVTAPEGAATLSPDGPWRLVASAPGIETPGLVYELMPGLWAYLPVEEDIAAGITWVLTAADVPVIEAYLQAQLTYYSAVTADPMDFTSPSWESWFADGGLELQRQLGERISAGGHADLDLGVVLRPSVLGTGRSESSAIVVDCILDGGVFVDSNGALLDGSSHGVGQVGFGYRLEQVSNTWLVAEYGSQEDACG